MRRATFHADMDDDERADAEADWADRQNEHAHDGIPSHLSSNSQLPSSNPYPPMGMTKNYLNTLLCACAPENGFAQDAIEHAITSGHVPLTMHPTHDVVIIMRNYDTIIDNYRRSRNDAPSPLAEATMQFAACAGLPVTEVSAHFREAA